MKPNLPACGEDAQLLWEHTSTLVVTGSFPSRLDRTGSGSYAGTVTVTNNGARLTGVTAPEAGLFVVQAGKVVCTPLPTDLVARRVDLAPGASQDLVARGSIVGCVSGEPLTSGTVELWMVVVVHSDDSGEVVGVGGPRLMNVGTAD